MIKIWFLLVGIVGGVLAGMGMGGGTMTIPLLVIALGVPQLTAQFINLLAFLPSGIAALAVHLKNKLVSKKGLPYILLPALVCTCASSCFAVSAGELLGKLFGGFLIIIALYSLAASIVKKS